MAHFRSILVGVDLSHGDWLASSDGETPSHFACSQAIDLASAISAAGEVKPKIHFLAALDLDERTKSLLSRAPEEESSVVKLAEEALRHQVSAAATVGVEADSAVVLGRSRIELVNAVREGNHDLIVVGSRAHGLLSGVFMGSTALELLRKSLCPVWVVKSHTVGMPRSLLVGTDFSPVCNALFDMAVELAHLFDAQLHVTHVVEAAKRPFLQFSNLAEETIHEQHDQAMALAKERLDALVARPEVANLNKPIEVHLEEGTPSEVILAQTTKLVIDLLLFGTVAWPGVPGLVIGSQCQKMLPSLGCSLLTIRPDEVD